jgi:hypothetical protein
MSGSDGVSGSDSAFTTLIGKIGDQVAVANDLANAIGTDQDAFGPMFGDFAEANELLSAFHDTGTRLYAGAGIFHNALRDLHDGTVGIQKNYSDADNSTDYAAQKLKSYDDYLNSYVGKTLEGS